MPASQGGRAELKGQQRGRAGEGNRAAALVLLLICLSAQEMLKSAASPNHEQEYVCALWRLRHAPPGATGTTSSNCVVDMSLSLLARIMRGY